MVLLPSCRGAFLASTFLLVWLSEARGDCGPPKAIPNTEVKDGIKQSYPEGARVTYNCISGYEPSSPRPRVIECLPNSVWSELSLSCRGRQCPAPDIENGRIVEDSELRLGDVITFACDEGHRVVGRNGARCIVQNNKMVWSNEPPHCERIPCLPPPEIANGNHNGQDNYVYGSAVRYRCAHPFSLIGEQTIVCESDQAQNGRWSAPAPECKVVSCRTPEVPNGIMRTSYRPSYTYQDRILFACKPGFKLKDNRGDSSCAADSTWQPPLPECILDIHPTTTSGGDGSAGHTETPESPAGGSGSNMAVAVAIGTAVAVIAVIIAIIVALKCRARHKRRGKTITGSAPESYTAVPHNTNISLEEKA